MTFFRALLLFFFISLANSIKFQYEADKHEFFCFNEPSEKQSRYQIMIKSSKPNYFLQVFDGEESVYEDQRLDSHFKEYSAYVRTPVETQRGMIPPSITVCLVNKELEEKILYQIEFYHGLHLENSFEEEGRESLILNKMAEIEEIQGFVKAAYEMNSNYLSSRGYTVSNIGSMSVIGTITFVIVLFGMRLLISRKIERQLRNRKFI